MAAAIALGYAGLAIGNGLDRIALYRPALAGTVPAPFADNALEVTARAALDGDPQGALRLARRLVARAPVEPSGPALLGAALGAAGDNAGADRAFRVAGRLGWRVPLTQAYWLGVALERRDMRVAALRLDALLRQRPELLRTPAVLAPFEADDAGRAALAARLAVRPPWLGWYVGLSDAVPADVLARRSPGLVMLGDGGVRLGCETIAPAVRALAGAGFVAQARALRHSHCPNGRGTPS